MLDQHADQKYVVCKADEGDSGTFSDRMLMEGDPFPLIEGMMIAGVARGRGHLGKDVLGSGRTFELEVRMGAGAYVCGEETSLLESLEGKRAEVRFRPPLPAIKGLFGQPTIINNVISLASLPVILERGAAFCLGSAQARGNYSTCARK